MAYEGSPLDAGIASIEAKMNRELLRQARAVNAELANWVNGRIARGDTDPELPALAAALADALA